jgi:quercetin dioxygenase-like cupin family protein
MPLMLNGIKDADRHECRTVCRDQRPAIESEVVREATHPSPIFAASLFGLATRAHAQSLPASAGTVHVSMTQPLRDQPGTDVTVLTVEYPPNGSTAPHEHAGHIYTYVLEGAVISQLDDQPPQTYTTGQMWSEAPHQHHMVSKNASATAPAELLVFMIAPHGQELTNFLPAK